MQTSFLKNLALVLFLNVLIKPFWIFGVDLTVQNQVGDAQYGFFLSMYSFSLLFYILLDLGITNYNNRNIAQNQQLVAKHFAGIASVKLILGLAYGFVILITGFLMGYSKTQLSILIWLVINQFLLSFLLYLRSNISGLMKFTTDSLLSVLDRVLMIFLCGLLLWSGMFPTPIDIHWYVYAQTVSYLLAVLVALTIVLSHTGTIRFRFNFVFSIAILRKSLPFALLVLLMSIYNRLEPVLLERLLPGETGLQQTGIYGRAFRLFDAGNNISLLFAALLLPMFSSLLKRKEDVQHLVKLSFTIIITMSLAVAISSILYGDELFGLLFQDRKGSQLASASINLNDSIYVFRMLMSSFVAVSASYIFGTLLTAAGNLRALNILSAIAVAINLLLNFILIPQFQAFGASITSLTVQTIIAVAQFLLVRKLLHIHFGVQYWFRLAMYMTALITTGIVLKQVSVSWMIQIFATMASSLIFAFGFKLLSLKHLGGLLREVKTQ